jgi:hypothetical protein
MTQDEKDIVANAYGISATDLEELLAMNPELAERLTQSFGASLMPDIPTPEGQHVGPYREFVAPTALQGLTAGVGQGIKTGLQMRGQGALINALRNRGDQATTLQDADAVEASAPANQYPFGDTTEDPMAPVSPVQTSPATPPPQSPTLAQPPAGARPIPEDVPADIPPPTGTVPAQPGMPYGGMPQLPPGGFAGPQTNPALGGPAGPGDLNRPYRGNALRGQDVYGVEPFWEQEWFRRWFGG